MVANPEATSKFTPGPWMTKGRMVYALNVQGLERFVFSASVFGRAPDEEVEANAILMAAAPDLYDAIEALLPLQYSRGEAARLAWVNARAALAKARGEVNA